MMVKELLKKATDNPLSLLDWAIKVGVAAAIGLYLVVKMVALLTVMVEANLSQGQANTAALVDIQKATTEMAGVSRTLEATNRVIIGAQKEQSALAKVASEAATSAREAATRASLEVKETNMILRGNTQVAKEQLGRLDELVEETRKQIPASNNKMLIEILRGNAGKLDSLIKREGTVGPPPDPKVVPK